MVKGIMNSLKTTNWLNKNSNVISSAYFPQRFFVGPRHTSTFSTSSSSSSCGLFSSKYVILRRTSIFSSSSNFSNESLSFSTKIPKEVKNNTSSQATKTENKKKEKLQQLISKKDEEEEDFFDDFEEYEDDFEDFEDFGDWEEDFEEIEPATAKKTKGLKGSEVVGQQKGLKGNESTKQGKGGKDSKPLDKKDSTKKVDLKLKESTKGKELKESTKSKELKTAKVQSQVISKESKPEKESKESSKGLSKAGKEMIEEEFKEDEGETSYRLNKILARAEFGSRRGVEKLIEAGRVTIDGKRVNSNVRVSLNRSICVDGKQIQIPPTKIFLHYKKRGVLVTHAKDRDGKLILFQELKKKGVDDRLISVGRLDYNTEGLIILTNSGSLARHLELPKNKYERKYAVEVFGSVTQKKINALNKKIFIDGVCYQGTAEDTGNSWLEITLRDGKNRHIRKVLKQLYLEVKRLMRIKYGPYSVEGIPVGGIKEVPLKGDLQVFKNTL